jgi:hypothetical protein
MAKATKLIPLEEFSENIMDIVARVLREREPVVIETEKGEFVELSPVSAPLPDQKTIEDWEAFRAAAGSWSDVDIDTFLDHIYASRSSSRPPVDL